MALTWNCAVEQAATSEGSRSCQLGAAKTRHSPRLSWNSPSSPLSQEIERAELSRAQLLELVWGYDFAADTNVVDVFIGYLRRKLEAGGAPRLLHTVRGVGFVLRTQ